MVAALHEEFGFSEPDCSVPHDNNTPRKKRHAEEPMSTNKKPKVGPVPIDESPTLTDELKRECAMANFKGGAVQLQIRSTQNCLVNTCTRANTLPAYKWICGLPRGTFKLIKTGDEVGDTS